MRPILMGSAGLLLLVMAAMPIVWANDRADYNARVAARLESLFQTLDRNADGVVTREESRGDLNLGPRFDDIDVNRDGILTREELRGYIERRYSSRPAP
jgi:Ca2+-binding EF-hand superfamily protein